MQWVYFGVVWLLFILHTDKNNDFVVYFSVIGKCEEFSRSPRLYYNHVEIGNDKE